MDLENIRIVKEMRNNVNRQVNCETANLGKTVEAAMRQLEDIRYVITRKGLGYLPKGLEEIAMLRLENESCQFKELGMMLDPPVGKSGVNHRLRKKYRRLRTNFDAVQKVEIRFLLIKRKHETPNRTIDMKKT
ncbi:MAG: DNA-binding protein WhiA [Clostridia bacterium]